MKQTLPILLLTACCTAAVAAPLSKPKTAAEQKHYTELNTIFARQNPNKAASKTTGALKRLIANSYWANGKIVDTNHYYYSGDRGSSFTDPGSYNDAYWVTDKQQNIMSDSSVHWVDNGSGFLQFAGRKMYSYDAGNRVTQMISMYQLYADVVVPTYNGSGKVSSLTVADTNGVTGIVSYIPKSKGIYTYNSQNLAMLDSTYLLPTGLPSGKTVNSYDANGNLVLSAFYQYAGGMWQKIYGDSNVYDANNRLIISVNKNDFGAGFNNFLMDSFAYNGNSTMPYYHMHSQWDASVSAWEPEEIWYQHYNAQNMLDTYYLLERNMNMDTVEMDVYTYGPDGLLQHVNGYQYINHQFLTTPYDQTTEYFEEYFPVGISNTTRNDVELTIFPNPAQNAIALRSNSTANGSIKLYNAQGLLMEDMQHVSLARQTINISTYPPGNYFIHIADEQGVELCRSAITKQ